MLAKLALVFYVNANQKFELPNSWNLNTESINTESINQKYLKLTHEEQNSSIFDRDIARGPRNKIDDWTKIRKLLK